MCLAARSLALTLPQGSGAHEPPTPHQRPPPGHPSRLTSHQTRSGWRGTSWSPCCTWWTSGISKHPKKSTSARGPERGPRQFNPYDTPLPLPRSPDNHLEPSLLPREHFTHGASPNPPGARAASHSGMRKTGHQGVKQLSCGHTAGEQCWGGFLTRCPHLATFQRGKNTEGHGCSEPRKLGGRVSGT